MESPPTYKKNYLVIGVVVYLIQFIGFSFYSVSPLTAYVWMLSDPFIFFGSKIGISILMGTIMPTLIACTGFLKDSIRPACLVLLSMFFVALLYNTFIYNFLQI
jgi:hypothetical protein